MQALRQFHTAENGTITIQLPADFPTNEVEVIVLPKQPAVNGNQAELYCGCDENRSFPPRFTQEANSGFHPEQSIDEGQVAIQQFLTMDTSHFTPEQVKAYERTCALLRKGRKPSDPPIFGLFEGLIEVSDDFYDPLPDEIIDLFYGSETDEYGISLHP